VNIYGYKRFRKKKNFYYQSLDNFDSSNFSIKGFWKDSKSSRKYSDSALVSGMKQKRNTVVQY